MAAIPQPDMAASKRRGTAILANRLVHRLSRHWLLTFSLVWGLYVGLPWLAPAFLQLGWTAAGQAVYGFYSTQCHQLPQRSFFLFGPQAMYSLDTIQAVWANTDNPLVLRQFIGNPELGWKVAWSDRMVSMYTSLLLFGWLYGLLSRRQRVRPLPIWAFVLLLVPMGIDGLTHMVSDLAGIDQGFRDTNAWLATVTGNVLPASFYAGDALGSFNSWMRLISGVLFGLGVAWLAFPYLATAMADAAAQIEAKFRRAGLSL